MLLIHFMSLYDADTVVDAADVTVAGIKTCFVNASVFIDEVDADKITI